MITSIKPFRLFVYLIFLIASFSATYAHAQSFTNSTVGNINDNTLCPGATGTGTTANLTRTFNVSGLPTSGMDLNVGFLATHSWRGDIRLTLRSPGPSPVSVVLITEDTSNNGNDDDYNLELGDEGPVTVNTGAADGPHDVTLPPYQILARPNNPLADFNAVNPNGTWTLEICDDYAGETGQYLQSTLFFTSPTDADLSLAANINDSTPDIGDTITLTITAANAGQASATGVTAQVNLPTGLSFISSGGSGSYNSTTGVWTLPASLAATNSTSLTIQATVLATGSVSTSAEILTSDQNDPDSTPGNNVTSEDDYDAVSFSPQFGPDGPGLTCPLTDQFEIDWTAPGGTTGWNSGDLTNTYNIGGDDYVLTMTGATNRFISRTYNGSTLLTPVTTDQFQGGNTNGDYGVVMNIDYTANTELITTTMTLGTAGIGVEEIKFGIFDVDNGAWIDEITINGSLSGAPVTPVLFEGGTSVSVSGNVATGVGGSASASGDGNLWVRFDDPVDTVSFTYENASPTADPASQVISLQPITMCPRLLADITAVKSVEVYDPGNLGLYMTPGNEVLYKITVNNSATATAEAEDIDLSDTMPSNVRFISATTTGFTSGAFGSPALPPTNTDCDSGACVIHFTGGTLPIDTTGEVIMRALIK